MEGEEKITNPPSEVIHAHPHPTRVHMRSTVTAHSMASISPAVGAHKQAHFLKEI